MGFEALYDNASVRRRDRLLSAEEAAGVLRRGEYGFLAMQDAGDGAYGVPISYVWDGGSRIYLHCAPEGRKQSCLERHPEVTFCVVGATHVVGRKFTTAYESVILRCRAVVGPDEEERWKAPDLLLCKYAPEHAETGPLYAETAFPRPQTIRLDTRPARGTATRTSE